MSGFVHDDRFDFTGPLEGGGETTHPVYVRGSGPPVLILQELPGIGQATFDLVAHLCSEGFRIYLPHVLGRFGRTNALANSARLFCVRREFDMFLRDRQSPIAAWMRALTAEIGRREAGAPVGVIGMCLTGSFALVLIAEDGVAAAVASQPALPVRGGDSLHMSGADIARAQAAMDAKGRCLAMRYAGDRLVPDRRKAAICAAFDDSRLEWIDFPGKRHALLTEHLHPPALARATAYLRDRLAG